MLFNSYEFLFAFLPFVLVLYYLLRRNDGRIVLLTLASYFFYGWWDYRFCFLMLLTSTVDYLAGRQISRSEQPSTRKRWIAFAVVTNLSVLGFFKYFDLAATMANRLAAALGFPGENGIVPLLHIVLPVGISFYTFQSMSYSIDVYRRQARPAKNFWHYACFVSLFPQLVAGPIVRYQTVADQLLERDHTTARFASGLSLFILGLAKKVLLADAVAPLANHVFGMSDPGLVVSWVGVLAYTMQIYFDFSAYSDMAVGLGRLIGFEFPQNFNSPYKAESITDFWRRWHMSLSTWLRDYLYIPLGGNRRGPGRTYINLILTMFLGGLWHGANWTFALWGLYHGSLLALERAFRGRAFLAWPRIIRVVLTFVLVQVGWVLFRCPTLDQAAAVLAGMAGLNGRGASELAFAADWPLALPVLPLTLVIVWFLPNTWEMKPRTGFLYAIGLAVLFCLCVATMMVNTSSPFLYFQF